MIEIAEKLRVDSSTIYRDQQFIKENTKQVLIHFLNDVVPYELVKCLTRLNNVSDGAWKLYDNAIDDKMQL
jgi:hypothetical protein